MDILRIILSVALAVLIHRHAIWWGHCFFTLHGMKLPVETPVGYLLPSHRLVVVYLFHLALIVAVWQTFPYGHWGLLAILVSIASRRTGQRRSLLYHFGVLLLLYLENGDSLDEAWEKASGVASLAMNLHNPNVGLYRDDPGRLIRYVAFVRKKPDLVKRWARWLQLQSGADDHDLVSAELNRMDSGSAMIGKYCIQIATFVFACSGLALVAGVTLAFVQGKPWWWGPAMAAVCFMIGLIASATSQRLYFNATAPEYRMAHDACIGGRVSIRE